MSYFVIILSQKWTVQLEEKLYNAQAGLIRTQWKLTMPKICLHCTKVPTGRLGNKKYNSVIVTITHSILWNEHGND